jgi:hypothetical protein
MAIGVDCVCVAANLFRHTQMAAYGRRGANWRYKIAAKVAM